MKSYENKFIIGVDHGYGNIKTANHCFKTGITAYDTEPLFTKDMLIYNGKYYLIGEGHKEFLRDKVQDNDYYCLTLVAIAMELSDANIYEADVIIAAGLPLAWTSGQKQAFAKYLSQNEDVTFTFRDVDYNVHISDVKIFPQGYSAILPYMPRMKGLSVMADIGNGTMNMMFLENGRPKAESKMYTEKFGVYQCTLAVRAAFSKLTQREIDDFIIDTVLREGTADISKSDLQIITATAQEYVEGIFRRLREHGYDAETMRLYICGGGGCLVKHFYSGSLERVSFIDYRINVRFRPDRPDEKEAADYLSTLGKSRNQFIVDALIHQIRNQDRAPSFSLSDIRKVVREKFQTAAITLPIATENEAELSNDISELDPKAVLDSLSMFD